MGEQEAPRRPGRPARPVTREHLLKVAREAFSQLGYAGASMGDIAARAGIRKSSLFHHFATKDELYREALTGILDELSKHVAEALQSDAPFVQRMTGTTRAIQSFLGHAPRGRTVAPAGVRGRREHVPRRLRVRRRDPARERRAHRAGHGGGRAPQGRRAPDGDVRAGIHILFSALPEVSARMMGTDIFAGDIVEARTDAAVTSCVSRRQGPRRPTSGT